MTSDALSDQTQAASATLDATADLTISLQDKAVLRTLAGRVAELAGRPIEAEKRTRWRNRNALKPGRPLIFCDPENGWNEIITERQRKCEGRLARQWEMTLRKEIFWGESMGDDRVIEPRFVVHHCVSEEMHWGLNAIQHKTDAQGSYVWDAPIRSYAKDFSRLCFPRVRVDDEATGRLVDLAECTLGDLLAIELKGAWWWTLGMTWTAITLRGLQPLMLDMCLEPEGLKELMGFLRDGTLAMLDALEENGLLTLNNDSTYVGSGGFGYTDELPSPDFSGQVRTKDMWGFCESQETAQVAPVQFEEFIFPYQMPIMERFGLNCYGCCEPLHLRWDIVKRFPNLRRVSVSPWCDLSIMADKLQDQYVFSMKPNPAVLATPEIDKDGIRRSLREALAKTKGCHVEVIMKDNHTIGNNPQNVIDWCRIAKELAEGQ